MFVIVEGIDRVGKSTLCKALKNNGFITLKDAFSTVKTTKGYEMKLYPEQSAAFPSYSIGKIDTAIQYIKQLNDAGFNIVADRLHLTELVYGNLDRPSRSSETNVWYLDNLIDETFGDDVALVYVEPDDISSANVRAERDLTDHDKMFEIAFYRSSIKQKLITDFYKLNEAVEMLVKTAFKYDFYFASPFFRPDQVEREERLKAHLRILGYRVFSPKESCHLESTAGTDKQSDVFSDNINAIKSSAAVFAITDTKDMGTIWEAGYAFASGKPVVYFAETLGNNQFNLMLAQSGRAVFTSQNDISREDLDAILFKGKKMEYRGVIE